MTSHSALVYVTFYVLGWKKKLWSISLSIVKIEMLSQEVLIKAEVIPSVGKSLKIYFSIFLRLKESAWL